MNVFVAGYKGLVGSHVSDLAEKVSPPVWFSPETAVFVNCAGYTNVDGCEDHPKESYNSNVAFVSGSLYNGKKYVQLSTDFIFDGRKGNYSEDDQPAPLSVYGAQKWIAETLVREHPNHLIIRTTCVFGWHEKKYTFAHWVRDMCKRGEPFGVTNEQVTTPTYAPDLARIIMELAQRNVTGIVNVTSGRLMSRFSFARDLADAFGYPRQMIFSVGAIEQRARRPALGGLSTLKLEGLGIQPQDYDQSLKELAEKWGN